MTAKIPARSMHTLAAFVPHARFEVLEPFQKYAEITPEISEFFLFASRYTRETARFDANRVDAESYHSGEIIDLMKCGDEESAGSLFRTSHGRLLQFSAGEINFLATRGVIRLYIC